MDAVAKSKHKHLLYFFIIILFVLSVGASQTVEYPYYGMYPDKSYPSSEFQRSFKFLSWLEISRKKYSDGEPVYIRYTVLCRSRDYSGKIKLVLKGYKDKISDISVIHKEGIGATNIEYIKEEFNISEEYRILGLGPIEDRIEITCNINQLQSDTSIIELKIIPTVRSVINIDATIWLDSDNGELIQYPGSVFFIVGYKWSQFITSSNHIKLLSMKHSQIQASIRENSGVTRKGYVRMLDEHYISKESINRWLKKGEDLLKDHPSAPGDLRAELEQLIHLLQEQVTEVESQLVPEEKPPNIQVPTSRQQNYNPDSLEIKLYNSSHFNRDPDSTHQKLLINNLSSKFWIYYIDDPDQTPIDVYGIKHCESGSNQAQLIEGADHKFQLLGGNSFEQGYVNLSEVGTGQVIVAMDYIVFEDYKIQGELSLVNPITEEEKIVSNCSVILTTTFGSVGTNESTTTDNIGNWEFTNFPEDTKPSWSFLLSNEINNVYGTNQQGVYIIDKDYLWKKKCEFYFSFNQAWINDNVNIANFMDLDGVFEFNLELSETFDKVNGIDQQPGSNSQSIPYKYSISPFYNNTPYNSILCSYFTSAANVFVTIETCIDFSVNTLGLSIRNPVHCFWSEIINGTFYSPSEKYISILGGAPTLTVSYRDFDQFDDDIIAHEFGHLVFFDL